jgi:hypothetical protein
MALGLAGCGWDRYSDVAVGTAHGQVVVLESGGGGLRDRTTAVTSTDGGFSWHPMPGTPTVRSPAGPAGFVAVTRMCVPGQPRVCYRVVEDSALVQRSDDGGRHWRTVWRFTAGRRLFAARSGTSGHDRGGRGVDLRPTSLVVSARGDSYTVIVACRDDGMLVRWADGRWQRTGLAAQAPALRSPVSLTGFGQGVTREYLLALCAGWLAAVLAVGAARGATRPRLGGRRLPGVPPATDAFRAAVVLAWCAALETFGGFQNDPGAFRTSVMLLFTLCFLCLVSLRRTPRPRLSPAAHAVVAAGGAVTGLLALLPFLGWTVARPDSYRTALALALFATFAGAALTGLLAYRANARPRRPAGAGTP